MPRTFGGTAEKRKPSSGRLLRPGHMLADRDVGAEQRGVNRPRSHARVVDIVAVDPDQRRSILDQPVRRSPRSGTDDRRHSDRSASDGPSRSGPTPLCRARPALRTATASIANARLPRPAHDDPRQVARAIAAADRPGRFRRHSGGTARRDRCRCWRPCRCGRSGRSSRHRNWRPMPSRVQKSQMCGPGRPG